VSTGRSSDQFLNLEQQLKFPASAAIATALGQSQVRDTQVRHFARRSGKGREGRRSGIFGRTCERAGASFGAQKRTVPHV